VLAFLRAGVMKRLSETTQETLLTSEEVLTFWFGKEGDPHYGTFRSQWFSRDAAFDEEIRGRFLDGYEAAAAGRCDDWAQTADGALALVIVLDQFPRNLFRGSPRSFATDAQALGVSSHAISRGLDRALPPLRRSFLYTPNMHSENLEDQRRSVELFESLGPQMAQGASFARKHLEIVERFGRFPHRNAILGRESSPEEASFLTQPGSSF